MATQDDFIRTALRVPPDLHKAIHEAAEKADRTFNAEIVARLRSSFESTATSTESLAAGLDKVLKELESLHEVNQVLLRLNTYPLDGSLDISSSDDPPT